MSVVSALRFAVRSVADQAMSFALFSACAGCGREGTRLCRDCRLALEHRLRAGAIEPAAPGWAAPAPLEALEWCAPLTGITRRVIDRLGDAGDCYLSRPLGEAIAHRWRQVGGGGDVLVPVPAPSGQVRDRGFDEAVLLARVAGRRLGLPVVEALERLSGEAPVSSSGEIFDVIAPARIDGRSVVLVDAVVGSGERLAACAVVLLRSGARAVSAVTVARDQLPQPVSVGYR